MRVGRRWMLLLVLVPRVMIALHAGPVQADTAPEGPEDPAGTVGARMLESATEQLKTGDAEATAAMFGEVARMLEEEGNPRRAVEVWKKSAEAWIEAAQLGRAADALQEAGGLASRSGAPAMAGETFFREAVLREKGLNDLDGSLLALQNAQRAFEAADEPKQAAITLTVQAMNLALMGRAPPVVPEGMVEVGPVEEAVRFTWFFGRSLHLKRLGHLDEALVSLDRAEEAARQLGGSVADQGRHLVLIERGRILQAIPRLNAAIQAFREARRVAGEEGDRQGEAIAWHLECETLGHTREEAVSEICWQRFREAGHEPPQQDDWAWHERLSVAMGGLNAEGAGQLRQDFDNLGIRVGLDMALMAQAALLVERGESKAALRLLSRVDPERLKPLPLLLGLRNVIAGTAHGLEGRPELGIGRLIRGTRQLERSIRSGLVTPSQKVKMLELVAPLNALVVGTLHELDRPYASLLEAEAGRARVFLNELLSGSLLAEGAESGEAHRQQLEAELAEIERSLRKEPLDRRQILAARRDELDRELEALRFEAILNHERAGMGEVVFPLPDRHALRELVGEVGPVLYYYWIEDHALLSFLLLPGEERVFNRSLPADGTLPARLQLFAPDVANPLWEKRGRKKGRHLYEILVEPLADQLPPGGPLVVVPHGPLHQVPFAALLNAEGEPLGTTHQLSVVPSLHVLKELVNGVGGGGPASGDRLLALAAGRSLSLPIREVKQVAALFDPARVEVLVPGESTFAAFRRAAPKADQILIASRAVATPDSGRKTYVELDGSEDHDTRLTADEIATLPLDAELVTLAACDTARSQPMLSDEQLDLARAFLLAGSRSVLATRWKLPENHRTSRFLQDFYRLYRGTLEEEGARKDEALRQARLLSRERGDPSQIWAAWVLVGSGR